MNLRHEAFRIDAVDISRKRNLGRFPGASFDVIVHCASSGRGGAAAYESVYFDGSQNLLDHFHPRLFVFAGSTSVYAQTEGNLVDEKSIADPLKETGKILRRTEEMVLTARGTVARLAGLYGPGRCVPLERLLSGDARIEGEGERFMNLVHQADAVSALTLLAQIEGRGIFNVVDDEPVPQSAWYLWVCERLGRSIPPLGPRDLNRKRGWTNKRVSNLKLRSLGWNPHYPTFREGMSELIASLGDSK
jgi:nucleoside-diphosphate-sugar epimerase